MPQREVHLEHLLGRHVLDSQGKSVGRVEEVIAEQEDDEWVVREYLVGRNAMLYRLAALELGRALWGLLGAKKSAGYRVPWDKLDLSDPHRPRLLCPEDELEKLTG